MSVQEQIARAGEASPLAVSTMNLQTRHSRRSRLLCTLIGSLYLSSLLGIAPVPVRAGQESTSNSQTVSATVSFTDLDLTTPAGITAVHKRLVAASQRLCHELSDSRRASNYATTAACYRQTLAEAIGRFNALLAAAKVAGADVARSTP